MKHIREKVRQETSLSVFYAFDITDQAERCAVAHASHDCVQTNGLKLIHKRLHSDPVISQEHHGFLSALMCDIHHLFGKLRHFSSLECLKIKEFL